MKKRLKNIEENINEIMSTDITNPDEPDTAEYERKLQIVHGWESVDRAASDLYGSIHSTLLAGAPVFLYRNTNDKSDLIQLVVVKNMDKENDYSVGMMTAGWTALYPHLTLDYIDIDVTRDLEKYKVDKNIILSYKQIINRLKDGRK